MSLESNSILKLITRRRKPAIHFVLYIIGRLAGDFQQLLGCHFLASLGRKVDGYLSRAGWPQFYAGGRY